MNIYKAFKNVALLNLIEITETYGNTYDKETPEIPMLEAQIIKLLSIRLNNKGEPDPEGRYAVKVVDLAEKLPDMELYYEGKKLYFHPESIEAQYYKLAQQDMLSAGFVKEIKEATDGR